MGRNLRFIILFLLSAQCALSQRFTFQPHAFGTNVFAGGIDQPRFQFVDIDGDQDPDLFILDRDDRLWFYRNAGGVLRMEPNVTFGITAGSWFRFVDIDGDGDADCMTNGMFSEVSLYTNIGTVQHPQFQLTQGALLDTSGMELFSERFSIPTFADIDGDGDFDFFSGGSIGSVSFYENIGTPFVPQFTFVTGAFGGINIQGGPKHIPKALHGASGIEFFDADSNGVLDMFWGDYFNPSLYYLYNSGTKQSPNIALVDSTYPNEAVIATLGFNVPQHVDVDSDGLTDLIVGSVFPSAEYDNFHFYKNTGSNAQPFYSLQTKNLIPMIDAGSRSSVAAADFDGDGDIDIVVSSASGAVHLYENSGSQALPVYFPVPVLTFTISNNFYSMVTAGDINNDGKPDLVIGNFDGRIKTFANMTEDGIISFSHVEHPFDAFSVGQNSAPCLTDLDGDGDLDLLIGNSGGQLSFWKNIGTNAAPSYARDTLLTLIDVGNDAVPFAADIDLDGTLDLLIGNSDGTLHHYRQSQSNFKKFDLVSKKFEGIEIKTQSAPCIIDLDADGDPDVLLGNGKGGVFFYQNSGTSSVMALAGSKPEEIALEQNYPNPFNPSTTIPFSLPSEAFVSLEIFDLLGRKIETVINNHMNSGKYSIHYGATNLPSGTYVYRLSVRSHQRVHAVSRRMVLLK